MKNHLGRRNGLLLNSSSNIIGNISGQIFLEVCLWSSLLVVLALILSIGFRSEYDRYRKALREKSGHVSQIEFSHPFSLLSGSFVQPGLTIYLAKMRLRAG